MSLLVQSRSLLALMCMHSTCRTLSDLHKPPLQKALQLPLWHSTTSMLCAATISVTFDLRICSIKCQMKA